MTETACIPDTAPALARSDQNLIWLDCEMTGLDPEKERIIEIAVIATDPQWKARCWSSTSPTACWTQWTAGTRAPTAAAA
jgi:hypothetical protein